MSGTRSMLGGMSGPQKAAALMLAMGEEHAATLFSRCLLYTSPSPRD